MQYALTRTRELYVGGSTRQVEVAISGFKISRLSSVDMRERSVSAHLLNNSIPYYYLD